MAKLSSRRRKSLPKTKFALPEKRAYPVDTRKRAANAKGRARQQLKQGKLSRSQYGRVVAKANRVLKSKKR